MEEYTCMIPRDTYDGAFYRAVLALHDDQFPLAQQCVEKARDILDTDLTAMAGESYNRAYGVCLHFELIRHSVFTVLYFMVCMFRFVFNFSGDRQRADVE